MDLSKWMKPSSAAQRRTCAQSRRNTLKAGLKAGHKTAVMGMLDRRQPSGQGNGCPPTFGARLPKNEILNQIEGKSTVYTDRLSR